MQHQCAGLQVVDIIDVISRASLLTAENWTVFASDAALHASDHRVVMLQIPGDTLFATPPAVSIDKSLALPLPAVARKKFNDDFISEWQQLFMVLTMTKLPSAALQLRPCSDKILPVATMCREFILICNSSWLMPFSMPCRCSLMH